jgi:hypothetical protein
MNNEIFLGRYKLMTSGKKSCAQDKKQIPQTVLTENKGTHFIIDSLFRSFAERLSKNDPGQISTKIIF